MPLRRAHEDVHRRAGAAVEVTFENPLSWLLWLQRQVLVIPSWPTKELQ